MDAATGQVAWTPTPAQRGTQAVVLRVDSAAGTVEQRFEVEVACPARLDYVTTCGCGAGASAPAWVLVGALVLVRRRRG